MDLHNLTCLRNDLEISAVLMRQAASHMRDLYIAQDSQAAMLMLNDAAVLEEEAHKLQGHAALVQDTMREVARQEMIAEHRSAMVAQWAAAVMGKQTP